MWGNRYPISDIQLTYHLNGVWFLEVDSEVDGTIRWFGSFLFCLGKDIELGIASMEKLGLDFGRSRPRSSGIDVREPLYGFEGTAESTLLGAMIV